MRNNSARAPSSLPTSPPASPLSPPTARANEASAGWSRASPLRTRARHRPPSILLPRSTPSLPSFSPPSPRRFSISRDIYRCFSDLFFSNMARGASERVARIISSIEAERRVSVCLWRCFFGGMGELLLGATSMLLFWIYLRDSLGYFKYGRSKI